MYKSFFHVCLLLPFCLAISGCNDSNDDVHAESSVTIGLIFPLSAPKGKPRHHAALLAVQHLTEAGYSIKTVVEDSKLDRFLAVEAARRLVEVGGAKVLIGASSSSVTMEIADWVSVPNQIPQISYASTSLEITELNDDDFVFRTAPSDKLQGAVLAYLAKEIKGYDNRHLS
ncbi:MAG: ABC transporter substrate-binding protein [Thiomargarita sp.]|nr:ABC transporter substrate-binding protein [Thiomargarita sp.]